MQILNIDLLGEFLPVVLYVVVITLVIILSILGVKLIMLVNKLNRISDNVETKVNSLNGIFSVVDKISSTGSMVFDRVANSIVDTIGKFRKKKEEDKDE